MFAPNCCSRLSASLWVTLACFSPILASGCNDPSGPEPVTRIEALPRELTTAEREVVDAGDSFAFSFLAQIVASEDPGRNLFVSPLSASMALGTALAGAENLTYAAMRDALGLESMSREEIGASYHSLIQLLTGLDPSVRMEIGNSVWLRMGFHPETAYVEEVEADFEARVTTLEFDDPAAADTINDWVADATDGLIDGIVTPPIDPDIVAFLINAIYFQGDWTVQFDPVDTRPGDFRREDGTVVTASMMRLYDGEFPFALTPDYAAVELPYGGEAFAMTLVLPTEGQSLDDFVAQLDSEVWADILASLSPHEPPVVLPKFKLEYEKQLNEVLTALGMEPAFDPFIADFSRMHRDALEAQLHISQVKQKAYVEVDEKGTKAAAVTSVSIKPTSAQLGFTADRPFLFVIRERLSGTILFTGLVHDPTSD
ncbi:MAG: serpin family protein [marine benthic group bacterium]|nr:serpin family protein [Gemmatimonadota bacterium]